MPAALPALFGQTTPETSRRLLLAALEAFAEQGYHATTTRDIARRVGRSPAAVYIHYRSKDDLLVELSRIGHQDVLRTVEDAVAEAGPPAEVVRRFVTRFAAWHAEYHALARVVQHERRALPPAAAEEVRTLRRRFEPLLRAELVRGGKTGEFTISDLDGTTLAILSLCIDVARWYEPGGGRKPAAIGELYADLVLRMLRTSATPAPDGA